MRTRVTKERRSAPKTFPKTFPGRAFRRAAVAFIFAALLCAGPARAQTDGPSEEVVDAAQTPAGELSLVRRREAEGAVAILVKLGGRVLAEKGASDEGEAYTTASVYGLYPEGAPRYAVVELTVGALVCAAKFAVVDLTRGAARVSKDFGNCGMPRVAHRRGALTITFPAGPGKRDPGTHYVGPGQVWSYSNGRLRRVGGRR